jgi:putative acetyltransferase
MSPTIRGGAADDAAAIRRVTDAAFAGAEHASGTEGAIVDALRAEGTLTLSLVAATDGAVIGHVAFSPVTVGGDDVGWFGLGPVSVLPGRQRQGIGAALIREGLARLRANGVAGCVVLGDPAFYRRFGFAHDPGLRFEGAPAEYFLRLPFTRPVPSGAVAYRPAFYMG